MQSSYVEHVSVNVAAADQLGSPGLSGWMDGGRDGREETYGAHSITLLINQFV